MPEYTERVMYVYTCKGCDRKRATLRMKRLVDRLCRACAKMVVSENQTEMFAEEVTA